MKTREHRRSRHFNILLIVLAIAGLIAAFVAIDPLARASQRTHLGRMNEVGAYLESTLDLDAAQTQAWDQVERELAQGLARLHDTCGEFASDAEIPTMPERLAFMESAMAAGTETLRTVRPAFEAFYGMLEVSGGRSTKRRAITVTAPGPVSGRADSYARRPAASLPGRRVLPQASLRFPPGCS